MLASAITTLVACAVAPVAEAISIVPGNEATAEAEAARYPAVGQLAVDVGFGPFCTGSLVSDSWFLTAAHCDPLAGEVVSFGDDLSLLSENLLARATIVEPYLIRPDDDFNWLDGADIALLQLDTALDDIIEPIALLNEPGINLLGLDSINVGWGDRGNGTGVVTDISQVTNSAAVHNTIDAYGQAVNYDSSLDQGSNNILSMDFDELDNPGVSRTGDDTPIPFEGQVAVGDSGGPALVQIDSEVAIAGVLSGGTTSSGEFGDVSWWTGLEAHFDWINNTIASETPDQCVTWLNFEGTAFRPCDTAVLATAPAPAPASPVAIPASVPQPVPVPVTDSGPEPVSVPEPGGILAMLLFGVTGLGLAKK